jgi:hypothetical protein
MWQRSSLSLGYAGFQQALIETFALSQTGWLPNAAAEMRPCGGEWEMQEQRVPVDLDGSVKPPCRFFVAT